MGWLRRNPWIMLAVLAVLAVSAGAFVVHLHFDGGAHPGSCALCAAAQHGSALPPTATTIVGVLGAVLPVVTGVAFADAPGHPDPDSPRAPPLS